jgi:hypothetical protein
LVPRGLSVASAPWSRRNEKKLTSPRSQLGRKKRKKCGQKLPELAQQSRLTGHSDGLPAKVQNLGDFGGLRPVTIGVVRIYDCRNDPSARLDVERQRSHSTDWMAKHMIPKPIVGPIYGAGITSDTAHA